MVKLLLSLLLSILFITQLDAQNCPTYANVVSSSGEACGNQNYTFTIENTSCNGTVTFTIEGFLEGGWGINTPGSLELISIATGNNFFSPIDGGVSGTTISPTSFTFDPNIEGTAFNLILTGAGGNITISQNGIPIANVNGTGNRSFIMNVDISPATLAIQTPSGTITRTVENCNDFILQVPLANSNFCNTLNIDLPWEITCDVSGAIISSGTHSVIVNPQVPSNASDLVDITWNTTTCSWDIAPQNDCDLLDIGTIFTVSPDPTNLDICAAGDMDFTIDYLGISGAPNCCATAGSLVPIEYSTTIHPSEAIPSPSPYLPTANHSGYISIPPNNLGGDATILEFCVEVSNYYRIAFPGNDYSYDNSWYISIFIDGAEVELVGPFFGASAAYCIDLADYPSYNQSSTIKAYVIPNQLTDGDPPTPTIFAPNKTNGSLNQGEWKANISATFYAEFEEMIGSPVDCSFTLTRASSCCGTLPPPTASNPAAITVACAADVPAPDPTVVTDEASSCTAAPTVTFVSDVSDNNVCQGE